MNAQYIQWLAEIAACNARIAGMQAANQERAANNIALAYDDQAFGYEADQLERIAQAAGIAAAAGN